MDSTIISAPSSTKNRERARDPEMHQTRKGRQWFFGMKLHSGTDARTGLVHSVSTTAANVSDVTEAHRLLHGGETAPWTAVSGPTARLGTLIDAHRARHAT